MPETAFRASFVLCAIAIANASPQTAHLLQPLPVSHFDKAKLNWRNDMARKPKKRTDAAKKNERSVPLPLTGSEEIPPGATRKAFDRPLDPGSGIPGSAAGPRHAAGDEGSDEEETGWVEMSRSPASPPVEEED